MSLYTSVYVVYLINIIEWLANTHTHTHTCTHTYTHTHTHTKVFLYKVIIMVNTCVFIIREVSSDVEGEDLTKLITFMIDSEKVDYIVT